MACAYFSPGANEITSGGGGAHWGRGGRELFFVEDETLKSVSMSVSPSGSGVTVGKPVTLFPAPSTLELAAVRGYSYDPHSDRFLFTKPPAGTDELREIAVSIGWGRRLDAIIREKKSKQ